MKYSSMGSFVFYDGAPRISDLNYIPRVDLNAVPRVIRFGSIDHFRAASLAWFERAS